MQLLLLAFLTFSSPVLALDTFTETRDVTDAAGNSFSCTYSLVYDSSSAKVYRQQSGVACEPNVNGKQTIEDVVIEAIGKTATVTYTVKQDKTGISKIALADYIAPSTASPTTAAPGSSTAPAEACANQWEAPSTSTSCDGDLDLKLPVAKALAMLAMEKAMMLNVSAVIAIMDRHNNLVLHMRMCDAMLGSIDLALQKARGSALFPMPTSMFSMVDGIELSNGVIGKLGGGVPLTLNSGVSAGSIGISGAMTPGDDEVIAMAAAAEIDSLMEKSAAYKAVSTLNLEEAMASNPPSKDPSDSASMRCPLIPAIFSEAPAETAMIYWERSMTLAAPGLPVDTADMVERPVMMWNADPAKLYTVIAIDEGISRLQEQGLGYLHWVVTNVPGDKVYAGDENYEYVPPFGYMYDDASDPTALVYDGTPLHAIMFLVYEQPGRINMTEGQSGCSPDLAFRVGSPDAIASQYGLGSPVAANFIYTKCSAEGTDWILCKFSRCNANPRGDGPFPTLLPGVNDMPECTPE